MNHVDSAVDQLVAAILDSDVYREYDIQRNRVNREPEMKARIDEFRRKNYELQNANYYAFEKLESFEKEYEEFREKPLVADFLEAELAFCRMIQDINLRITEAVNFE